MTGFSFSPFSMPSSTFSPFSSSSSQQSQGFGFSNLSSSSPSPASSATSNLFSGAQPSSAPNLFSGSQPSSASKFSISFGSSSFSHSPGFPASTPSFGVASGSAASSSPAPSFRFPTSSSSAATTGSSPFGASFASSTAPANPAPSLFGASSAAPSSASASAPTSSGLFSSRSSSSSPFSASSTQAFSFGTGSVFSKSNTTAAPAAPFLPATTSSSLSSSSSSTTSSFSYGTPSSSSFQSSFVLKSAPSATASAVSTTTSGATATMPASLGFGASSVPSISSTVTTTGDLPPAASTTPSPSLSLFSSQAASTAASTLSVPVSGVTDSLATNASMSAAKSTSTSSASKSTTISSSSNGPSPFPSFSLPTKISAPTPSSQPQSTASAAMFELTLKDDMGRMQVEKPDLVEVGAQSDLLPAHKVNQVAGSEIVSSGPSEAEPCMERMQVENPVLEVGVQPVLLADIVNHADGSDILRTGPEGVPPLDKVVDQVETSAKPFDVLADYPSTEYQPVEQTMVQSTPVDTVREFEAAAFFQESELNRIFLNLFVSVEGFLVPRPYVELYRKILRRYGHMATTEVLTDCPLGWVGVATEVMRLFEEMSSCTKADLSEDLLRHWDFRLSSAESLKFNVDWLRQRLEEVKSSYRHQIENANAIDAVRSSLQVTESKLTALIARREDHLKSKQAAEGILKAAEAAMAMVNATLQQDDEEISVFEAEKLGQLVKLCVVEGDFMPGVSLASDLL